MTSIAPRQQIASAAAVLFGRYGDVTRLAHQRGCCRQALYRQTHDALDPLDGSAHRQQLEQLRQRLAQLQARCDQLEARLRQAAVMGPDQQARFAATAQALGVSLSAARALLVVLRGPRTPSV